MKKYFIFATALAALASCSSDDFVGESPNGVNSQESGAISFSSSFKTITRADHVGADAADMLGEKFYVGGYKNDGTSYSTVFDHYLVQWGENTAATTTDNTSDWKYVGLTPLGFTGHIISGAQTIKYWDFAANYYNFVAFSAGKGNDIVINSEDLAENKILATAIDPANLTTAAYTLQGSATDLAECYIADLITAKASGASSPDINYKDEVAIKFRSLGSKVRIALYETIPGYSVRNVLFYAAGDATTTSVTPTLFASSNVFHTSGTMTVSFPTIGTDNRSKTDYNKAHVSFTPAASGDTPSSTLTFGSLNYETDYTKWEDSRLRYSESDVNGNTYLKRTSTEPSFAGTTTPYYLTVLPDETGNVLELRVDYTLESIDGTKETITVHGATAFVPQIYAAWKPNYAYTYIFKISDNTNGWTNAEIADKAGLYPITFDAIVADSQDGTQSTITTVSTPSITTYQKGHVYTDGPEYKVSTDSIYIRVMNGSTIKNDLDSKGALYTVTATSPADLTKVTEADVMDALNIRTSGEETTVVGRNGFTLTPASETVANTDGSDKFNTIPGADGNAITGIAANTASRFLPTAGTYAYVYDASPTNPAPTTSYFNSAVVLEGSGTAPTDWNASSNVYYSDAECTLPVNESFPSSGTHTYYKKYSNLNKVYAVKVIRVI